MRLFVTGSTGFIGSHFVRAALAAGHDVTALRFPGTQPVIPIPDSDRLTWIDGDLNAFLTAHSAFRLMPRSPSAIIPPPSAEGPAPSSFSSSALVHLAAYGVSPQTCTWQKAFQINVSDSLALMERAIESGIGRIVVSGSCVEYGQSAGRYENIPSDAPLEPVGPYAASKAAQSIAASALCREKGIALAILRLFTVFGEGQHPANFWPSLKKAALAGEDFPMTPGEQVRDFIPVDDVAQAFLKAVELLRRAEVEGLRSDNAPQAPTTDEESRTRNQERAVSFSAITPPPQPLNQASPQPLIANVGAGKPQTLLEFAGHWWNEWGATGKLLPGALPYRPNEAMRYVPEISPPFTRHQ